MPAGLDAELCCFPLVCSEHTVGGCRPFVQPSLKTLLMGNQLEFNPLTLFENQDLQNDYSL